MWKRLLVIRIMISLLAGVIFPPQALSSAEPQFRYRPTGNSPLLYRTAVEWREETEIEESIIQFNADRVKENKSKSMRSRCLDLEKKVWRQTEPMSEGLFSTRIESLIQNEEPSEGLQPLEPQMIANFYESQNGEPKETYSVEALSHLGIPLLLPSESPFLGKSWQTDWRIRLENGSEESVLSKYEIEKIDHLAGHRCAWVTYHLASKNLDDDQWIGEGRFAFDVDQGKLVIHEGELVRTKSERTYQESGKVTRQTKIYYEIAEALVH